MEALGDLDELVCALGVALAQGLAPGFREAVREIQRDLFSAGSDLAVWGREPPPVRAPAVDPSHLDRLEAHGAAFRAVAPHARGFVIPGETAAGAQLDLARAMARRLERRVAALPGPASNPTLRAWLNRLSDTLWWMARAADGGVRLPADS